MSKKAVSPFDPAYKGEVAEKLMEHKRVHGKKAKPPNKAVRQGHELAHSHMKRRPK
jgi:hypothetical protein